jgi:bifunctional UDP-N-acetylglucosamine pyrophosphorylase/glucosamine-1-phosphate N-acetyltransferase
MIIKMEDLVAIYTKEEERRRRRNMALLAEGVLFADINTAYIDEGVVIGKGAYIGPCVTLEGSTVIGEDCRILQNTRIKNSDIGRGTLVEQSVITDSQVGEDSAIGPFAYLRPDSKIGDHVKVGDFVEVKNSSIGNRSKASHLTYIGDSDVGEDVNLGCGIVFVNYDGKNKHRSTVGNGAFIGCNVNIISPVNVGDRAYIAAGTTVTKDVPEGALSVGRVKERNIEGWVDIAGLLKKKK